MKAFLEILKCDVVATDGDAMRRKTFCKMSKPVKDVQMKKKLDQLLLFDLNVINGEKALYFDDKHCAKRFRGVIVSESCGCKVDGFIIARDQLLHAFKKAGISRYEDALNPADRQNVGAVLKLHQLIEEAIKHGGVNSDEFPGDMLKGLKGVWLVFDGILCVFADPSVSLRKQLTKLSVLSHDLLYLYRRGGTNFIPGQLYHDLQRMVQGSYFATASLQEREGGQLHLYQLGTDQVARLFASVRTITYSRNCDGLELCHRLQHAQSINDVMLKHPTWKRSHGRRLCGLKDFSSEVEWTGDLNVNSCSLHDLWMAGRSRAVEFLDISDKFFTTLPSGVTMLKPNKRLAGVTVDEDRIEVDLLTEQTSAEVQDMETNEVNSEEAVAAAEIEEALADVPEPSSTSVHSKQIEFENKLLYKVSVVKEFFGGGNAELVSTDRLKRVRGYSKFCDVEEASENQLDLDDAIMVEDFIARKVICDKQSTLCVVKILSLKDKGSGKYNTAIPSDQLTSSQVTGRLMPAKVDGLHLKIGAPNPVHEVVWEGTNCTTINVQDSVINLLAAKELLNQLSIASSKTVISSLLPYDKCLVDVADVVVGKE